LRLGNSCRKWVDPPKNRQKFTPPQKKLAWSEPSVWAVYIGDNEAGQRLGIIERLADQCPVVRTSPNAAPVREVLHRFLLGASVAGKRSCHVRWVMDGPAVATRGRGWNKWRCSARSGRIPSTCSTSGSTSGAFAVIAAGRRWGENWLPGWCG
jgi:hypothetical protein